MEVLCCSTVQLVLQLIGSKTNNLTCYHEVALFSHFKALPCQSLVRSAKGHHGYGGIAKHYQAINATQINQCGLDERR